MLEDPSITLVKRIQQDTFVDFNMRKLENYKSSSVEYEEYGVRKMRSAENAECEKCGV